MNTPAPHDLRMHDGIPYPHAAIAATRAELGRKPTIHELVMGTLDALTVRLDERYPGMAHDQHAIGEMAQRVEFAAGVLDAPPRGSRGGKGGRRERSATPQPDLRTLHWFVHVRRDDHEPVIPLFWAYQREFLGPNGEQLDHRTDARTLLLQAGYGIPDDLSALGGVNDTMTHRTDQEGDERG